MDRIYPNEPDTDEQVIKALSELNERIDRLEEVNGIGVPGDRDIPF